MRLDRFLTLGVVRPLRRASSLSRPPGRRALPILMYHSVSADPERGTADYYRTATSPGRFAEHMRLLARAGWRGASLRECLEAGASAGAERLAAITFDDGFLDFHTRALPVLLEHGFSATVFLASAFVAEPGGSRRSFRGRNCMDWAEAAECVQAGIELGSHTRSHPELHRIPWEQVEAEITLSKSDIEQRSGRAVTSFAYPFAFPQTDAAFCARLARALAGAGYRACVTTRIGCAAAGDDPFSLRRLPVNEADDASLFSAKLEGDYDWLAGPQRGWKALSAKWTSPSSS